MYNVRTDGESKVCFKFLKLSVLSVVGVEAHALTKAMEKPHPIFQNSFYIN